MTDDSDAILNDLLASWHRWSQCNRAPNGYYSINPACKLYRTSTQHDTENGARDSDADNMTMQAMDHAIDRIEQPWQTAIQINARNLATGLSVWSSPRLPTDDIDRAQMVVKARNMLMIELGRDGIT